MSIATTLSSVQSQKDAIRSFLTSRVFRTFTPDHEDYSTFVSYLKLHPDWTEDKIASLNGFRVTRSRMNKALQVQVRFTPDPERKRRSRDKWYTVAWSKCVVCKPKKNKEKKEDKNNTDKDNDNTDKDNEEHTDKPSQHLTQAMRSAVHPQIRFWKSQNQLGKCCAQCKSRSHLHVDHKSPTFVSMRNEYLAAHPTWPTVFNFHRRTCQPRFSKSDRTFAYLWQNFHHSRATYQWLCRTCNLKKGCQ